MFSFSICFFILFILLFHFFLFLIYRNLSMKTIFETSKSKASEGNDVGLERRFHNHLASLFCIMAFRELMRLVSGPPEFYDIPRLEINLPSAHEIYFFIIIGP